MIYTVTFNPAIDYVMHFPIMNMGKTNRASREEIYFGGKGINVSLVLKELGVDSVALGFLAGFTGAAVEEYMKSSGVATDFVHLENGFTRINVKVKSDEETELNGKGPDIPDDKLSNLYVKLDKLQKGDTLVLSGSIPSSLPNDVYEKILCMLDGRGVKTVVDATGELLGKVLPYKPYLIKPNHHELADFFGVDIKNKDDVIAYARKLHEMGARNVLVSMAGDGAVLVDENDEVHFREAYKGIVINSVGAGDSMIAGFLCGAENGDMKYALKLGTASGGATAFLPGLCTKSDVDRLMKI